MHDAQRKTFLVTGHPRSGTGYVTLVLKLAGYDVGHEVMGEHGVSSWMLAVPDAYQWFTDPSLRASDYAFESHICVVRDPVKTVASVLCTEVLSLPCRSQFVDFRGCSSYFDITVKSVVDWYAIILAQEPDCVFRLEEPGLLTAWLHERGYTDRPITRTPQVKYNARNHQDITAQQIRDNVPAHRWESFQAHCERFGYGLDV